MAGFTALSSAKLTANMSTQCPYSSAVARDSFKVFSGDIGVFDSEYRDVEVGGMPLVETETIVPLKGGDRNRQRSYANIACLMAR